MLQLVVLNVLLSIRTDSSGTNEAVNPKKVAYSNCWPWCPVGRARNRWEVQFQLLVFSLSAAKFLPGKRRRLLWLSSLLQGLPTTLPDSSWLSYANISCIRRCVHKVSKIFITTQVNHTVSYQNRRYRIFAVQLLSLLRCELSGFFSC